MASDDTPPSDTELDPRAVEELLALVREGQAKDESASPYWAEPTPSSRPHWQALYFEVLKGVVNPYRSYAKIGRFEAVWALGNGGHGCVYKVRDVELDRFAALKLCAVESEAATKSLMAEARTLAKLRHPNIVTVYETGKHGEDVFFVMEFVDGPTLAKYAYKQEQERSWEDLVEIFCVAGEALAAAHEAGVVHGDFKPSNVILERSSHTPYIVDFGVARVASSEEPHPGGGRGTLHYMAPEVLRGGVGDARSDQYSFCVSLWQCFDYGWPPYGGDNEEQLLDDIEVGSPPIDNEAVPERVREILRRGLSFEAEDRYPDMLALVRELRLALGPRLVVEREEPAAQPKPGGNNSGLIALVVVLATGLVVQYLRRPQPAPQASDDVSSATEAKEAEVKEVEPEAPDPDEEKGCVDTAWQPTKAALGICVLIREGQVSSANELWVTHHDAATPESAEEWETLVHDVISVSRTFEAWGAKAKAEVWHTTACNDYQNARSLYGLKAEELISSAFENISCE